VSRASSRCPRVVRARSRRVDSRVTRCRARCFACRPRAVSHSVACRHALFAWVARRSHVWLSSSSCCLCVWFVRYSCVVTRRSRVSRVLFARVVTRRLRASLGPCPSVTSVTTVTNSTTPLVIPSFSPTTLSCNSCVPIVTLTIVRPNTLFAQLT
jgi:hypothetical protein